MDSRSFYITFLSVWKLLGFSLYITRSFKIPQECISLGVFRSPSWVFFRPLRSENLVLSFGTNFLDQLSSTIFVVLLFWNSCWLDVTSSRPIFFLIFSLP